MTIPSYMKEIEINNSDRISDYQFGSKLYQVTTPVMINGNDDFQQQARDNNWDLAGTLDGSAQYPYVISGLNIALDTPSLILINNTNVYFKIINSFIKGLDTTETGIFLSNVTNAIISDNVIQNTVLSGIYLYNSPANNITGNEIFDNTNNGILMEDSNNNRISGNTISYSNYTEELRYDPQPYSGITLENSNGNILVKNNLFKNRNGIFLRYSNKNQITSNAVYQNDEGIRIRGSNDNIIKSNEIYENRINHGIGLLFSDNNAIIENNVYRNSNMGIDTDSVNNITINNNNVYDNQYGIVIWNTNFATVKYNTLTNNGIMGIQVSAQSDLIALNNTVASNAISKSNIGIQVGEAPYPNTFRANNTMVLNNTIYESLDYGIKLTFASSNSIVQWNTLYSNALSKGSQAYNNGTDNLISHNFWHDWTSPDINKDGVVDNPYPIDGDGNNFDYYPMVPSITFPDPTSSITPTDISSSTPSNPSDTSSGFPPFNSNINSSSPTASLLTINPTTLILSFLVIMTVSRKRFGLKIIS